MATTRDDIVRFLATLGPSEVRQLADELADAIGPSRSFATTNPPMPDLDEPTEFDVVMLDPGTRRIETLIVLRRELGVGLREAMMLADGTPAVLRQAVDAATAEALIEALRQAGATAERRP